MFGQLHEGNGIGLDWQDVPLADFYEVRYRSSAFPDSQWIMLSGATGIRVTMDGSSAYIDSLPDGDDFVFQVRAITGNYEVCSDWSEDMEITQSGEPGTTPGTDTAPDTTPGPIPEDNSESVFDGTVSGATPTPRSTPTGNGGGGGGEGTGTDSQGGNNNGGKGIGVFVTNVDVTAMPNNSNPISGTLKQYHLGINELDDDEESRLRVIISYNDGSTENGDPPNKICVKVNDLKNCFNSKTSFQFRFKHEDDDDDPDSDKVEFELIDCSVGAEEAMTINIMLVADGHISFPANHISTSNEFPTKIVNGADSCSDDGR